MGHAVKCARVTRSLPISPMASAQSIDEPSADELPRCDGVAPELLFVRSTPGFCNLRDPKRPTVMCRKANAAFRPASPTMKRVTEISDRLDFGVSCAGDPRLRVSSLRLSQRSACVTLPIVVCNLCCQGSVAWSRSIQFRCRGGCLNRDARTRSEVGRKKTEWNGAAVLERTVGEVVGATGFEPAASRSRTERSTRLSHAPTDCLV
jgi:hypothetical protein